MRNEKIKFTLEEAFKALNSKPKQKVFREDYNSEWEDRYNETIQNILDNKLNINDTLYLGIGHQDTGLGGSCGETQVSFQKTRTGFIVNLYEYCVDDFPEELEDEEGYDIDFFGYTEPSTKAAFNRWTRAGKPASTKVTCYTQGEEDFSVEVPLRTVIKDKKFNTSYDALKELELFDGTDGVDDICDVLAEINGKSIDLDDYDTINESKNKYKRN